ncbi:hypothetical protein AUP44_06875 [Tistrella mobilis]|uniref:Uncharacterized protein n=1 Tax=Tistrella mobilis TaxID=171437 RepID=A0A161R2P6_9PROT|nr:hypothetical protein AUP44_06875 [Tistrella mobilis]
MHQAVSTSVDGLHVVSPEGDAFSMTTGIRSFSAWLEDVDGFLAEASPADALDLAIGRLAGVLGFDSA